NFHGTVLHQLQPYPILVGLMVVALFALHGGLYLYLKTEGSLQQRLRDWMWRSWGVLLVLFLLTTLATVVRIPAATANFDQFPWAVGVVLLAILAIANIPRCLYWDKPGQAFVSSSVLIAALVGLLGLALYPNLVVASNNPAHSVTIFNAASSKRTLEIMLIIAAIGMPFVLTYSGVIYWTFRGKVKLDESSY
ncbi:MAG: cytochrome d ubiquinol oxidase subunit II, partial [Candidatus Eisenbacteria bacterium]|nr:cytochrome d ubiquinol oxidase subunit II [Candidatus Latescibacterota bacterium]MBD3301119.1 cytochrome d ubiquinol oxidase subunit II [Candidatus Eisenbacteria bacterium]